MHHQVLPPVLWFVLAFSTPGQAAPSDPAARGLALFVHAPDEAPTGSTLPVQVRVFGFPTVATLLPVAGATVEASWDPESLGDKVAKVPPPVTVACDGAGRAHLEIEVPPGRGELKLLVAARFAGTSARAPSTSNGRLATSWTCGPATRGWCRAARSRPGCSCATG